jgi:hypothetical protein
MWESWGYPNTIWHFREFIRMLPDSLAGIPYSVLMNKFLYEKASMQHYGFLGLE